MVYPKIKTNGEITLWYDFGGYTNRDISDNPNLYILSKNRIGKRIELEGTVISDTSYVASNYIEVKPDTEYIWHTDNSEYIDTPRIIFYDSNMDYIEGKLYENNNPVRFTTGDNIHYIRVTALTDEVSDNRWMIEEGNIPSEYYPGFILKDLTENKNEAIMHGFDFKDSINKYVINNKSKGYRIYLTGEEINDPAFSTSEFIRVKPNAEYIWHREEYID